MSSHFDAPIGPFIMMHRTNVLIAVFEGQAPVAEQVQTDLANHWPADHQPNLRLTDAQSMVPSELHRIDAAVVIIDRDISQHHLAALLTTLEQGDVPILAIIDHMTAHTSSLRYAGALILPRTAGVHTLAAVLLGLLHRQPAFRELRQDLKIAHRFHGGLESEMERMHEEMQLAAMVQRELLPREIPCLHGISLAALWRPANYVSGDIYDVMRLDEDHLGIFIADAVGHGVPAALMTMVISRSLVMKEVVEGGDRLVPPSHVLQRLNREMIRQQGSTTRFATGIYALLNCRDRTMTLAGAGHPHPIRIRPDDSIETIETDGGLLGVFEDESYPQVELTFEVGDRLILYSDGFEQAFPRPDVDRDNCRMPTTRYLEEFEQIIHAVEPALMIERLRQRLDLQSGSLHQADDLTLICMKVGRLLAQEKAITATAQNSSVRTVAPVHQPYV